MNKKTRHSIPRPFDRLRNALIAFAVVFAACAFAYLALFPLLGQIVGLLALVPPAAALVWTRDRNLATALDLLDDGIWVWDLRKNRISMSPGWYRSTGTGPSSSDTDPSRWKDRVHPDDADALGLELEIIKSGERESMRAEYRYRSGDGSWRWMQTRGIVARTDRSGVPRQLVCVSSDTTERKTHEEQLVFQAYHDHLTRLPNRKAFFERSQEILSSAERSISERVKSFVYVDLDDFRVVNDSLGHKIGDLLLRATAERIQHCMRRSDHIFHFGGDAFVIILTATAFETDAAIFAEKLILSFAEPFQIERASLYANPSIGISLYPRDGNDPLVLLRNAEAALYEAKRDRNTFRFFAREMQEKAAQRMELLSNLRNALKRDEFELDYQPIMNENGILVGLEALVRWNRGEIGRINPENFIPFAEESGLIIPLGAWVLEKVLADIGFMETQGYDAPVVSINVSARQLKDRTFIVKLREALKRTGVATSKLCIEITETCLVDGAGETVERLSTLRSMGIRTSLDDFGTGYSSLSYLRELPLDEIKIDRSFILALPDEKASAIVKSIVSLAHGLGKALVVEGIEENHQIDFIRSLGCSLIQGFIFSRPLPLEELMAMLPKKKTGVA